MPELLLFVFAVVTIYGVAVLLQGPSVRINGR